MADQWMLYGATGYTGRLIAREAVRQGLRPVLAGRSEAKLARLAAELDLNYRCFGLDRPEPLRRGLTGIKLVLLAAGPFSATSEPMLQACLQQRCHYLDITGEVDVLEAVHAHAEAAREAGVLLCPGVGFDVIPTDCLALSLKKSLPEATHLQLGFDSRSGPSPGTTKTMIEGIAHGGRIRRDGRIVAVPLAGRSETIDFGAGPKHAVTIPWGDVASAWYSTGIANIEVFVPMSPRRAQRLPLVDRLRPVLALSPVQRLLQGLIARRVRGPDERERSQARTYVWGRVRSDDGQTRTARCVTANGYEVTVSGSLAVVRYVLEQAVEAGASTPARLLGADFVSRLPGSSDIRIG